MGASLQSVMTLAILVPESFRGGCSFGVGWNRSLPQGIYPAQVTPFLRSET